MRRAGNDELDAWDPRGDFAGGSRPNELTRQAPVLSAAAGEIAARVPGVQFIVARAPHLDSSLFSTFAPTPIVEGRTDDVLSVSDLVLTASGTATVQTAMHGKPMVVLYKLSSMTYRLGRPLAKVEMYAMVNLIAGRRIVRELIQDDCTPAAVADEAVALLTDVNHRDQMVQDLAAVRTALGGPGASQRAADAVIDLVQRVRARASAG